MLELLVASLLLGMLVTILSMIFNQSSIAWRTGTAGAAEMDTVRTNVAEVREQADNVFFQNGQECRIVAPWNENGELRNRACYGGSIKSNVNGSDSDAKFDRISSSAKDPSQQSTVSVGSGGKSSGAKTYTVGVTSCGPDGVFDTYDDISSLPDEIEF